VADINGTNAGSTQAVRFSQVQWSWIIEIGDAASGATAIADEIGNRVTAESVLIRNLGGFSGGYWQGSGANANASSVDETFTVTGTADGSRPTTRTIQQLQPSRS
jgi:hypothetical protein